MAVDNYLYQYADGTTGNSPFQRDASGNVMTNAAGGVFEGTFLGRKMEDGSVNQSPLGNVTPQGTVNLYGGYNTSADQYYSNANEAIWGTPSGTGARPTAGYGTAPATEVGNLKPQAVTPSGGLIAGAMGNAASGMKPINAQAGWNGSPTGSTSGVPSFGPGYPGSSTGVGTGSSSGSSSVGSQFVPQFTNAAGTVTPWNVTANQTVAGNIESLLSKDSPLMQQARTRAAQQMASRGLINSSLAASAADSAMYDVANTIAQADAATQAKAAGYNVDQLNQQLTLDKQLANQWNQAQLSADTSRYATDVNAATQKLNNESAQLIARLNNDQQLTLQKMQNENQRLLQTNQQAAQAYNNSMQYIDVINRDPNLDSAAKTRAQAQIYYNLDTQLRTLSRVSGLDVSSNLSLANAPGFDAQGNYVGFDEQGNTKKP